MHIYIANCTTKAPVLNFRVPEMGGVISLPVTPGGQTRFNSDLNMPQIEAILKQNRKYGMVTLEEALNHKPTHEICWIVNVDKPVPGNAMQTAIAKNHTRLTKAGTEFRQMAALATSVNMREQAHTPNAANEFEMSVEEVGTGPEDQSTDLMGEGILVTKNDQRRPGDSRFQKKRRRGGN